MQTEDRAVIDAVRRTAYFKTILLCARAKNVLEKSQDEDFIGYGFLIQQNMGFREEGEMVSFYKIFCKI